MFAFVRILRLAAPEIGRPPAASAGRCPYHRVASCRQTQGGDGRQPLFTMSKSDRT